MPGLWDKEHQDPYAGHSVRALIRYNNLIEELRRRIGACGVDSNDFLRSFRSFQGAGGAQIPYPGLRFIGEVAQALHQNARKQVGMLREVLDIETLGREHPDKYFKTRIEALDSAAETGLLLGELGYRMNGIMTVMRRRGLKKPTPDMGMPTQQEIHELRNKVTEMRRLLKAARVEHYRDDWRALLSEELQSLSAEQLPQDMQMTCRLLRETADGITGSLLTTLGPELNLVETVPVRLLIDGKEESCMLPNTKWPLTNGGGQQITSIAKVLVASKNAAAATIAPLLLRSVSNFNQGATGTLDDVILNTHMAAEAIRKTLAKTRPDLNEEQIGEALADAGFGFTERQHGAVMRALNKNVRAFIKSAPLVKGSRGLKEIVGQSQLTPMDSMVTLGNIYRANGLALPDASGVQNVEEAAMTLLAAGKELPDERMVQAGQEIAKSGKISDIPHCLSLAGRHKDCSGTVGNHNWGSTQLRDDLKGLEEFLERQMTLERRGIAPDDVQPSL